MAQTDLQQKKLQSFFNENLVGIGIKEESIDLITEHYGKIALEGHNLKSNEFKEARTELKSNLKENDDMKGIDLDGLYTFTLNVAEQIKDNKIEISCVERSLALQIPALRDLSAYTC